MTTTEKITFFYRISDLEITQNLLQTNLYTSRLFNEIGGIVFYNSNIIKKTNEFNKINIYDIEDVTYFLNDGTINFKIALFNNSMGIIFNLGQYVFQILGGSGKYFGAVGKITLIINDDKVRNLIIDITY
jgi:hypothetical protein